MTVDLSAIARWPNVPACYDWLSLDRRGDWRLQGERVTHRGLIDFINRQYGADDSGCWFVQNGPQRVFVSLGYTPWIFRRAADGFVSHTGAAAGNLAAIHLDEAGNILLAGELGIGLLDDRDLASFLGECLGPNRQPAGDDELLALLGGEAAPVFWRDIALSPMAAVDVAKHFNFQSAPRPGA
jgi:hypothetical protein